jgi:hypothetical protein
MASGAADQEGRFVEVGQGFLGVFLGSRALRWMVPWDGSWRCCFMALALLGCYAFPRGYRCGWASIRPSPSYGLQPLDERDMASCQALSCPIALQWSVMPFWGMQDQRAWRFGGVGILQTSYPSYKLQVEMKGKMCAHACPRVINNRLCHSAWVAQVPPHLWHRLPSPSSGQHRCRHASRSTNYQLLA